MSQGEEVVTERVPWILIIVLSAFLGSFGIAWLHLLPSSLYGYYSFGEMFCAFGLVSGPFIVLLFAALFYRLTNKRVNLVTLTYLYVIGIACSWYVDVQQPFEWYDIVMSRHMNVAESIAYVPWFMAPPKAITSQLLLGNVPIPWGDWLPSIFYHWILYILIGLFMLAIATLFRRQWIDNEKMPFPHTLLAYELVKRIPEEKEPLMQRLGKPFIAGIVIGLAFEIPVFMTVVFPWFPDIYGWKTLCVPGYWYVTSGTALASIAGLTTVSVHPAAAAVGYIIPLSITFNVWFWYLVWLVLMQVSWGMGYYTGIQNQGGCGRFGWCSPSGVIDPPLMINPVTYGGGMFGLTIMTLVLNRRYLNDTFRAAFAKHSSRLEIEKNEALTYRDTYLLLGSSFILLVILFMIDGLSITSALLLPISYFLFWVAYARIYMMTGLVGSGDSHGGTLFRLIVWPTPPDPLTQDYVLAAYYSRRGMDGPNFAGGSMYSGLASYKMASMTGVSNSGVLKVTVAATVIAPLTAFFTVIWLFYTLGGTRLGVAGPGVQDTQWWGCVNPNEWVMFPSKEPVAPYVLAGFVIVVVLEFLHARFIWFPFNALGFVIGMSRLNIKWGFWGPFLVAWILKTITLRIGGSKLYDRLGVPIAAGFIVGYVIALIFGGTLAVLRFFMPY